MNVRGRKRLRLHNEDKQNNCVPRYMSFQFENGGIEDSTAPRVIDYSDSFALSNLLTDMDGGKYGSVTKDYESLHDKRTRVMNLLSAVLPQFTTCSTPVSKSTQEKVCTGTDHSTLPDQVNRQRHTSSYVSEDVIDLDGDSVDALDPATIYAQQSCGALREEQNDIIMTDIQDASGHFDSEKRNRMPGLVKDMPINNVGGEDTMSVIVLDSDGEDVDHQAGTKQDSSAKHQAYYSQARLESQSHIHLGNGTSLGHDGSFNQLVPYDHGNAKADRHVASTADWQPSIQYEKVVLRSVTEKQRTQGLVVPRYQKIAFKNMTEEMSVLSPMNWKCAVRRGKRRVSDALEHKVNSDKESHVNSSPNSSFGKEDQPSRGGSNQSPAEMRATDDLEDLWKDMSIAMEFSKSPTSDEANVTPKEEECMHSFLLEDDLGLVCRICGVIQKSIDTIFDYQWTKGVKSSRTYVSESRNNKDLDGLDQCFRSQVPEDDFIAPELFIHPRHMTQMKTHQLDGFNFLVRNLVADKPGGCILAHAPGSGKTFMLISFIQSFLARYPYARPLVVLPKGILPTWKKEFQRWQVEDIPLYDFYSSKADNRSQQLDVLINWEKNKSILFLGYKQFSTIVCGGATSKTAAACQERLLMVPSLLILDEGHTPRNESTDVLSSLAKVQTPRKVVLSGTLFQNHVKEVFNILNLVRPNFLKMESSRVIRKRILSRVNMSGGSRKLYKGGVDTVFFDLVEETLQNDDNYKRKVAVIQDLRELTKNVLHYYKGDFLDELPGLVDSTVLLNLSAKQKEIVRKLGMFEKFKRSSVGSATYIHPHLKDIAESSAGDRSNICSDEKIDAMLETLEVRDGVKAKFFLHILSLSQSAGERLLAFSQYLLPMKFLERLIMKVKGWRLGKEIFMITGDSSPEDREFSMERFNNSPDAKLLFGSIKACGEGISLIGASRIVILDVHLNPSVTRQAIGRAFRPGQEKKVYIYRLVAADSPEEEDHKTSFRKELISKMWFEWSELRGNREFDLETVDIATCEDVFLESPSICEDISMLYRR